MLSKEQLEANVNTWIAHPREPDRLILSWEAPLSESHRMRWAIAEILKTGDQVTLRYFDGDEFAKLNDGKTREHLGSLGYLGYPAFDAKKHGSAIFNENVVEAFLRRIPPAQRSDFPLYLERFRLRPGTTLSSLALLGITQARLPSDGFSLIDPLDHAPNDFDFVIEVAGHRHYLSSRDGISVGQEVDFVPEPENQYDQNALRVEASGKIIGYVNRLQAPHLEKIMRDSLVTAWLIRLNGSPDRPSAYVFLQVRPSLKVAAA